MSTAHEQALAVALKQRKKRRKPKETCKRTDLEHWDKRCLMLMIAGTGGSTSSVIPANAIVDQNAVVIVDKSGTVIVGK